MAKINDTDVTIEGADNLLDIPGTGDTKITPQIGIAAIALNFALKYHDINTVQDGALYQQYKIEGRNMRDLHLDQVFYTADQIEKRLLHTENRFALACLEDAFATIDAAIAETDEAPEDSTTEQAPSS